jgi:hypothetical protein
VRVYGDTGNTVQIADGLKEYMYVLYICISTVDSRNVHEFKSGISTYVRLEYKLSKYSTANGQCKM